MYIVWKVTARKFQKIFEFDNEQEANSFIEFANATVRAGIKYKVTKMGEAPIW